MRATPITANAVRIAAVGAVGVTAASHVLKVIPATATPRIEAKVLVATVGRIALSEAPGSLRSAAGPDSRVSSDPMDSTAGAGAHALARAVAAAVAVRGLRAVAQARAACTNRGLVQRRCGEVERLAQLDFRRGEVALKRG